MSLLSEYKEFLYARLGLRSPSDGLTLKERQASAKRHNDTVARLPAIEEASAMRDRFRELKKSQQSSD